MKKDGEDDDMSMLEGEDQNMVEDEDGILAGVTSEEGCIRHHKRDSNSLNVLNNVLTETRGERMRVTSREPILTESDSNYRDLHSASDEDRKEEEREESQKSEWEVSDKNINIILRSSEGGKKKKSKKKKRKKSKHKDRRNETALPSSATKVSSKFSTFLSSSSRRKRSKKNRHTDVMSPESGGYVVSVSNSALNHRQNLVRISKKVDGSDKKVKESDKKIKEKAKKVKNNDSKVKNNDNENISLGIIRERHRHHVRRLLSPKGQLHQTNSEVDGAGLEMVKMNKVADLKLRKSERLKPHKYHRHQKLGFGVKVIGKQMKTRSKSSSIYETVGSPDLSTAGKDKEKRPRGREQDRVCFSDSEIRDVFSEEVTPSPTVSTIKDFTISVENSVSSALAQGRKGHDRKRMVSTSSDILLGSAKKMRLNSESSDQGRDTKGGLNGVIVNGEGSVEKESQSMKLVWAKCRGYPSYPALVCTTLLLQY